MAITRHRAQRHVKEVDVSEATRDMARPAGGEVMSFLEEYRSLKSQKQAIQADLSGFSKAAMLKEQQRIRREFPGRQSLDKWIDRSAELEEQRSQLVKRMTGIERRMAFIKEKAKQQEREQRKPWEEDNNYASLLRQILQELREIKIHLSNGSSEDRPGAQKEPPAGVEPPGVGEE